MARRFDPCCERFLPPIVAAEKDVSFRRIRNCSGTQFDPLVSEAFLDLIDQGVISE